MGKPNRPPVRMKRRSLGGSFVRLLLGIVSVAVLFAAPLCVAQAQSAECEAMVMAPMESGDHQDQGAPSSTPICAIGCRLAPQVGPQIAVPVGVAYEAYFDTALRALEGIEVDPAVPPPRWAV
jgi:hypothetical protein